MYIAECEEVIKSKESPKWVSALFVYRCAGGIGFGMPSAFGF